MSTTGREESLDPQVKALEEEVQNKLEEWTRKYMDQVTELTTVKPPADSVELPAPMSQFFRGSAGALTPITYQWFDLLAVGPFQQVASGGPFLPHRIIRAAERAVMIAALWRNPLPLPGGPNPSAAQIMSPFRFTVLGETVNLSSVTKGPDFSPVSGTFGGGFVNIVSMPLPTLPPADAPREGRPTLLEVNLTIDILGVGPGLPPFAGFATRWFQPDLQPPFMFPFIPGVGPVVVPGVAPGVQNEVPVRILIYT
jgi:hypothetical protein